MKVLYLSVSFRLSNHDLYNDLVNELVENGHDVTVASSNYQINDSYIDYINYNLRILNIKTSNPFEKNLIKKGINQITLNKSFVNAIKKFLEDEKFELILYATPPITLYGTILYCKKKYNAKTFLMLKDIFPQNAVDLNMFKKSGCIYKYFRNKEIQYYMISDYIGCMSLGNIEYLLKENQFIAKHKVGLFPNSIKIKKYEIEKNISEETTFIFGGNLGKPQYIDGFLALVDKLKEYNKAKFVICGDGTEKYKIINYLNKSTANRNLKFYDKLPKEQYDEILKSSDVGFICLDPRFTIPNIPSKLQNYLMLKKPVFAYVDKNTDLSQIIDEANCGWHCFSDDIDTACQLVKTICEDKSVGEEKGKNGFKYLVEQYDIKKNVEVLEKFMEGKLK